jgi:uncharacterized membrane protein YqhA
MDPDQEPLLLRLALSLRVLMLTASLGALIGALLMFWEGGTKIVTGLQSVAASNSEPTTVIALVMKATDALIFGVVLLVFSFAITFGFVFDTVGERARLPRWMRMNSLSDLKHTLVEVIIVYLIVDFATDVAEEGAHLSWDALVIPLSISLIAAALRLMSGVQSPGQKAH